ncbi:hypothetical protein ACVWXN_003506 [Bradyrhizobium sp. i1.4.4]
MRCDPVELNTRPRTAGLVCAGCGCTDNAACPEGCYWIALEPQPLCSQCAFEDDEPASGFFGEERCPASPAPALHVQLFTDENSGYCARCKAGFVL